MLTARQKQIFDFVEITLAKKGIAPTHSEIARHLRLKSVATIHEHLAALQIKGYLQKLRGHARAISLHKPDSDLVSIPLLGIIAAGRPIEPIENRETIAISREKIKTGNLFALRVSGESMVDEGIHDNDVVLVRQQQIAKNGDKVVALINNNEATLKTFYSDKNGVRLLPANKNFAPIVIGPSDTLGIQGVVVDVIKKHSEIDTDLEQGRGHSLIRTEFKELPLNQILCGDAIETMRKIPSETIDMCFADPPFNLNKKYGNYKDKKSANDYVQWCEQWLSEMVRVAKPSGSIFVHNIPKWLVYYASHLNKLAHFKHWIAWDSMSSPLGKTLLPAHYGILFYTKVTKGFKFNELRSPHKKCRSCGEMIKDYGGKKSQINPYGTLLSDVWMDIHRIRHINRRDLHPCQLPEPLLERLILMSTDENDIVLDPFIGAGTTALAAKRLGRHFIGIDIDPKYQLIVEKKLKQVKYRQSNGYAYGDDLEKKTSSYLRNLTLSEKEGVYPLDR